MILSAHHQSIIQRQRQRQRQRHRQRQRQSTEKIIHVAYFRKEESSRISKLIPSRTFKDLQGPSRDFKGLQGPSMTFKHPVFMQNSHILLCLVFNIFHRLQPLLGHFEIWARWDWIQRKFLQCVLSKNLVNGHDGGKRR